MTFLTFARFLVAIFWIIFPFQLRTLLYTTSWYESGNFNPFTSFFIHGSDVILMIALICYGIALFRGEIKPPSYPQSHLLKIALGVGIILIMGILLAEDKILSSLLGLRWLEWGTLYYLSKQLLSPKKILAYFIIGMSIEAFIAIGQYIKQSSLGLQLLGEPILKSDLAGVAKIDWGGEKLLRSYATFPHPNVLGGALTIAITSLWYVWLQKDNLVNRAKTQVYKVSLLLALILMSAALIVSFSRSAWLALGISLGIIALFEIIWLKPKNKKRQKQLPIFLVVLLILTGGVLLLYFTDPGPFLSWRLNPQSDPNALNERLIYLEASLRIFWSHPWGVGFGHFTLQLPLIENLALAPWEFQPVHNIWLLILNEIGIIGFTIIIVGLWKHLRNFLQQKLTSSTKIFTLSIGSIFITISFFDHYFFTLYQGQVLLVLMLLTFSSKLLARNSG